jgi:hypothetical protein
LTACYNDLQDFGDPSIPEPQNLGDPYDPVGHRLLDQVQTDSLNAVARYSQALGPRSSTSRQKAGMPS